MKRVRMLAATVLLLVGLTACAGNGPKDYGEAYDPEMDYPLMNEANLDGTYIAETESGYYYLNGDFLYYSDKDTMKPIPLCNKPNCKHENETDDTKVYECNAYIGVWTTLPFLQYYKGSLYTVEGFDATEKLNKFSLVKISLDGTKREHLLDVTDQCVYGIHRDYLYMAKNGNKPKIVRVPMDDLNAEPEVIFESQLMRGAFYIKFKGNDLLINVWGTDEEDESYHSQLFICNILSGETTQMGESEELQGITTDLYHSTGDNRLIYYKSYPMETEDDPITDSNVIYTCDMDGKNEQVFKDFRDVTDRYLVTLSFDGTYYYEEWINNMRDETDERKFNVYDKDFNLICEAKTDWLPRFYSVSYGYGQYMFFKYYDKETKEDRLDYVDKSLFEKGIFEPHRLFDHAPKPVIGT